jgi:hypothetical protein
MIDNMFQFQVVEIQMFNPGLTGLFTLTAGYCLFGRKTPLASGYPGVVGTRGRTANGAGE